MARAMELAGAELASEPGARRGLTPDQLTAIGAELGIDEAHVRRALAEVLSAPPRVRALDRSVTASRHVELPPADCERILAAWFEGPDGLRALRTAGAGAGASGRRARASSPARAPRSRRPAGPISTCARRRRHDGDRADRPSASRSCGSRPA